MDSPVVASPPRPGRIDPALDAAKSAVQNEEGQAAPQLHTGETLMIKFAVPLALVFAAGATFACPGSDKMKDAKADQSPTISAAVADQAKQSKAVVEKKDIRPAEAKKPTS
jgi:hypothetical protein